MRMLTIFFLLFVLSDDCAIDNVVFPTLFQKVTLIDGRDNKTLISPV